jgi:hypothetical protein
MAFTNEQIVKRIETNVAANVFLHFVARSNWHRQLSGAIEVQNTYVHSKWGLYRVKLVFSSADYLLHPINVLHSAS